MPKGADSGSKPSRARQAATASNAIAACRGSAPPDSAHVKHTPSGVSQSGVRSAPPRSDMKRPQYMHL